MEPVFADGNLVYCAPYPWCGKVKVGDVIVLKHPEKPQQKICKRVVGKTKRF